MGWFILLAIIIGIYFFQGINALGKEIKDGRLFKKEKNKWTGRVGYETGHLGEEYEDWGCGTWFLIIVIIGIVLFVGIRYF